MEVFHCDGAPDEEFPLWSGPCGADDAPEKLKRCKKVLAAWAIGAGPFYYPEVISNKNRKWAMFLPAAKL